MRTMKSFLAIALLAIAGSASAQFANANASASTSNKVVNSADTDGWQKIYASYNPMKIVTDVSGADDTNYTAFSLGYSKGFSIAKDLPLFVEAGVEATYAFNTMDKEDDKSLDIYYEMERKTTYLSVNVPVSLAYKFSLSNKNISIVPYLGINLKGNIIGKSKLEIVEDREDEEEFWDDYEDSIRKETNWFDKKEAGSKDNQWKRFQFGWQLGVGIHYNQVYVGVGYGKDFNELYKKAKVSKTSITLGYSF